MGHLVEQPIHFRWPGHIFHQGGGMYLELMGFYGEYSYSCSLLVVPHIPHISLQCGVHVKLRYSGNLRSPSPTIHVPLRHYRANTTLTPGANLDVYFFLQLHG